MPGQSAADFARSIAQQPAPFAQWVESQQRFREFLEDFSNSPAARAASDLAETQQNLVQRP
jgi:hypothetical protein